jgi:hypothetical protein
MFKRAILGLAFVAVLLAGTVGFAPSASAYHGHCHGGGWYGAHYPSYHGYHHRHRYFHRYGGWGRHHHHYDHYHHGPHSGVSLYFGF